jgi:uncharacterized protein (DUF2141 family)
MKLFLASILFLSAVSAADLVVTVSEVASDEGEIGCALFREASGFPLDTAKAYQIWVKAKAGVVECRFAQLSPGTYAVAVVHDRNKNRKTDTGFMGRPKEDWGVSNNVRPKLRAPNFEEARFTVREGEPVRQQVKLAP